MPQRTYKPFTLGEDFDVDPNLGKVSIPLTQRLLASASGKDAEGDRVVTVEDVAYNLSRRRVEARRANPSFHLSKEHEFFGGSKSVRLSSASKLS